MDDNFIDYYAVLGVAPNATQTEITRAFRKIALQYHPDKNKDGTEIFQQANNANAVLSDPAQRKKYDRIRETRVEVDDVSSSDDEPVDEDEQVDEQAIQKTLDELRHIRTEKEKARERRKWFIWEYRNRKPNEEKPRSNGYDEDDYDDYDYDYNGCGHGYYYFENYNPTEEDDKFRNMERREIELVQCLAQLTGENEYAMMMSYWYHGVHLGCTSRNNGKYHYHHHNGKFFFEDDYRRGIIEEQRRKMDTNNNSTPRQHRKIFVRIIVIMHYLNYY